MALLRDSPASLIPEAPGSPIHGRTRVFLANPVAVFVLLSALFGLAALIVNPPLRGPDEAAHFLRAYGITTGDIIPSVRNEQGHKGIFLPARLHDDFSFFEAARYEIWTPGFTYRTVVDDYLRKRGTRIAEDDERPAVFLLYQGSEAYSPAPYLPYIVAAAIGRAFGLDFLGMFYLMRIIGFVAMTAAAAYAVAIVPHLRWTFLLIAMLPSALYGRTVIGADGAALSFTLVVTALCLRSACRLGGERIWERAAFMTLCVLSKPPQVAFVLLEAMTRALRELPRRWRTLALITLPGLVLTVAWVAAVSADVGAWRIADGSNRPAELFEPARKFSLLLTDPLHFPISLIAGLGTSELYDLWRQLIGVLGWLDTGLQDWSYPVFSGLLVASFLAPMPLDRAARYRIAAVSALAGIAYVLAVYLIFYLTWTPADALQIWGVQGRYFVVALPPVALAVAAMTNRGPSETVRSAIAICGAVLSGAAVNEAILRVNW